MIDPSSREVSVRGTRVELSAKEFALLRTLASEPTRVFTKDELLARCVGLQIAGSHENVGLARLPAAQEARGQRRPVRDERLGRRLPLGRRGDG
jgi:hypothetical protein